MRSKFKMERRKRAFKAGKILFALAILCGGGWYGWRAASGFFLGSDNFTIKKIEVRGNKNVSESEIIALLPFREGDNIFKVWLSEARKNLASCKPELKKISLGRRWQKIVVDLTERVPVACVTLEGQRLGLDDDNLPFPLRGQYYREQLPEVTSTVPAERAEALRFIKAFAPAARNVYDGLAGLYVEPFNTIVLDMRDGTRIYWGPLEKDKLRPKLERLAQILEDSKSRFTGLEYVNLNYFDDGRIIVKPRSAAAVTVHKG